MKITIELNPQEAVEFLKLAQQTNINLSIPEIKTNNDPNDVLNAINEQFDGIADTIAEKIALSDYKSLEQEYEEHSTKMKKRMAEFDEEWNRWHKPRAWRPASGSKSG